MTTDTIGSLLIGVWVIGIVLSATSAMLHDVPFSIDNLLKVVGWPIILFLRVMEGVVGVLAGFYGW